MMMVMIMTVMVRVMALFHGWAMEMGLILGNGINSKSGHGGLNIKGESNSSVHYPSYYEHYISSNLSFLKFKSLVTSFNGGGGMKKWLFKTISEPLFM